ncbi:hypothetical protein RND59_00465 [Vibrio ruber]|uniref:hypothetical protein n=1 Tax=Vibrio ruber TaxID=184755 RepID=UPI002892D4AA|nr:hypothetical protein [Vibrio ruber]WNJ95629.1 hypothetical protein RND59_00465 [Vibrio ruber]
MASLIQCFTPFKSTAKRGKPFTEEWLGFSGQDARKSRFWTTCDTAKQDFLVTLASWQE